MRDLRESTIQQDAWIRGRDRKDNGEASRRVISQRKLFRWNFDSITFASDLNRKIIGFFLEWSPETLAGRCHLLHRTWT